MALTAWLVTLNGHPRVLCATRERAGDVMDRIKAGIPGDGWRPVGPNGWSSQSVTSLRVTEMEIE